MSKREKFLFTKMFKNSSNKNFYKLYKYILKNKGTTAIKTKQYFTGTTIERNINSEIKQLYDRILKVLYIYQLESKEPNKTILKNLSYAKILIERGQNKRASRLLVKSKRTAYINEDYSLIVKIISLEEELNFHLVDSDLKEKLEFLRIERLEAIKEIELFAGLKYLKTEYIELQYIDGLILGHPEKYPNIFHNPLNNEIETKSKKSKVLWYSIAESRCMLLDNARESLEFSIKHVNLVILNIELFGMKELVFGLNNLLFAAGIIKEKNQIAKYLQILDSIKPDLELSLDYLLYFQGYLRIYTEIRLLQFNLIKERVLKFRTVKQLLKKMNNTQQGLLLYQYVAGCILIRKYNLALDYLIIWDSRNNESFTNIERRIFRIIAYTKLGQFSLLGSELKSLMKMKQIKSGEHTIGLVFSRYFAQFLKDEDMLLPVIDDFIKELKSMRKIKYNKKYFVLFDFIDWLKQERLAKIY